MLKKFFLLILFFFWSSIVSAGYFPMYSSWEQPDGPGSAITLTYSYSNLFDGSIIDASTGVAMSIPLMRNIFEIALSEYASVLPIHFVELNDSGPLPETGEYDPTGLPDIRVGQVPNVDDANAYAYFPFESSGLAGDIVFNAERFGEGWSEIWFYAVAQHELGHSLGMGHYIFEELSEAGLLSGESIYQGPFIPLGEEAISALQNVYGTGVGSVTAVPLPAAFWLLSMALGFLGFRFNKLE